MKLRCILEDIMLGEQVFNLDQWVEYLKLENKEIINSWIIEEDLPLPQEIGKINFIIQSHISYYPKELVEKWQHLLNYKLKEITPLCPSMGEMTLAEYMKKVIFSRLAVLSHQLYTN